MFKFLGKFFSGKADRRQDTTNTGEIAIEELNRKSRQESEESFLLYKENLCDFDPHSLALYSPSDKLEITCPERYFLKYIDGMEIHKFCPAQYWYYTYNMDYRQEIAKFLSENLVKISSTGNIDNYTIPQLKEILIKSDLTVTGKKADLINRINDNLFDTEIQRLFPIGEEYYALTIKGKELTENLKKSITKDTDLEDRCIDLIVGGSVNQAYKEIAYNRSLMNGQIGINMDWAREAATGLPKNKITFYQKEIEKQVNESDKKLIACNILCDMMGCPQKINMLIKRVCEVKSTTVSVNNFDLRLSRHEISQELKEMRDDGILEYEIIGTLDKDTCPVCGEMDGKHFFVSVAKLGKNCPPFHNGCRCTTGAYIPELADLTTTRAARDDSGNTVGTTAQNYKEWQNK
jgi:SPP1 gp7 family putative phage head morphogenesis protein